MLKDINGKPIFEKRSNKQITTIDYLKDYVSYTNSAEDLEKIIGFARYNPHDNTNRNFRNKLLTGVWYPILKFDEKRHGHFKLLGYNVSHYGLFDSIVALPEHKDKFNDILETNPRIKKYREKKRKEAIELEESRRESLKIMEQEYKEYKIIKKDLGYEPKKQPELNEYLRKKLKQSELFSLLIKDEKLRERVKKDLNFRIKKREIYKSTKDKGYSYKFYNRFDKYYFGKMKKLKNIVDNFDFSSERDLNIMKKEEIKLEREKRFEEGTATIMDVLTKKAEEVSNKVFRAKKRKI